MENEFSIWLIVYRVMNLLTKSPDPPSTGKEHLEAPSKG